jgi:hypothetical protein
MGLRGVSAFGSTRLSDTLDGLETAVFNPLEGFRLGDAFGLRGTSLSLDEGLEWRDDILILLLLELDAARGLLTDEGDEGGKGGSSYDRPAESGLEIGVAKSSFTDALLLVQFRSPRAVIESRSDGV